MRYDIIDNNRIKLDPEGMSIEDMLVSIAQVSYETARQRGKGYLLADFVPYSEISFQNCITYEGTEPLMLLMDYICGYDCRTKVYKSRDGNWYFDSYAFQQRKVTAEEFISGLIVDYADEFLDLVIKHIEDKRVDDDG